MGARFPSAICSQIWLGWIHWDVRIAAVLFRYQHVPTVYVMRLDMCATQHSSWDWQSFDMLIFIESPDLNKSIPSVESQWRDPKQILRSIIFRRFFVGGWWINEILHPNNEIFKGPQMNLKWFSRWYTEKHSTFLTSLWPFDFFT